MKLVYQFMAIFCNFYTTSNHHPLQVENCDSISRLVVDGDDNGKFRLERVNGWRNNICKYSHTLTWMKINTQVVSRGLLVIICTCLCEKQCRYWISWPQSCYPLFAKIFLRCSGCVLFAIYIHLKPVLLTELQGLIKWKLSPCFKIRPSCNLKSSFYLRFEAAHIYINLNLYKSIFRKIK